MYRQELKIDKFGRVLIPFEIRANLGLETGSILSLKKEKDQITLTPKKREDKSLFKKKNNILVYTGKLESKKAFENWEKQIREDRIIANWGLS
jgi:AbrB family looped-hinge helix DNA binding protein